MKTSKRRFTREKVLQILYAYELSKEPITTVMDNILDDIKRNRGELKFARELIKEVVHHQKEIEEYIRLKVTNWEYDRIAVIDKILLSIGIAELLYFPDIPPKVTIDEAIDIAKEFSTEKSGLFVNAILDGILKDLMEKNILTKTGRGLINEKIPSDIQSPQDTE